MSASTLLTAVESAIAYRLGKMESGDFLRVSFNGKSFENYSLTELFTIRKHLLSEVYSVGDMGGLRIQRMKPGGMI